LAFLTPLGHPVNALVMGSGGYSFRDYLKVGGPLTLIVLLIILFGLKVFWGL
jgi:di/tricarboxylate transporter